MPRGRRLDLTSKSSAASASIRSAAALIFLCVPALAYSLTAKKFGVSSHSLRNHVAKHISQSYRDAVRSGPLQSEEQLRRLVAESGAGVASKFEGNL